LFKGKGKLKPNWAGRKTVIFKEEIEEIVLWLEGDPPSIFSRKEGRLDTVKNKQGVKKTYRVYRIWEKKGAYFTMRVKSDWGRKERKKDAGISRKER